MSLFVFNSYSQDVIIKVVGDSIKAKVLEISSTEIKYKKFDNLNGPTYSALKSEIYMIRYENGSRDVITNLEPRQFEGELGQVCIIRRNGYSGSGVTFLVSIDDALVCKVKSNSHSEHMVKPGDHKISLTGNNFTVSIPVTVSVLPGRITYVELVTKTTFTTFNVIIEKISEAQATLLLEKVRESKKCL